MSTTLDTTVDSLCLYTQTQDERDGWTSVGSSGLSFLVKISNYTCRTQICCYNIKTKWGLATSAWWHSTFSTVKLEKPSLKSPDPLALLASVRFITRLHYSKSSLQLVLSALCFSGTTTLPCRRWPPKMWSMLGPSWCQPSSRCMEWSGSTLAYHAHVVYLVCIL